MKKSIFIILLLLSCNSLVAQPSMDKYNTSILIEWNTDTTDSYRFLQDSLEYGFLGFYESENFNYESVKDFINDSLNCPKDSAGILITKIMRGFKPIYFCDSIKSPTGHHSNPTVGLYRTTETGGVIRTGTMIEYQSYSAFINSDNNFILIMVIRNKFTKEYKTIVIRDRNGPQKYHLTIKVDSFDFKTIPEISYFDFIDINNSFCPSKIMDKSHGDPNYRFTYKTIYNISDHNISQAKIKQILLNH